MIGEPAAAALPAEPAAALSEVAAALPTGDAAISTIPVILKAAIAAVLAVALSAELTITVGPVWTAGLIGRWGPAAGLAVKAAASVLGGLYALVLCTGLAARLTALGLPALMGLTALAAAVIVVLVLSGRCCCRGERQRCSKDQCSFHIRLFD